MAIPRQTRRTGSRHTPMACSISVTAAVSDALDAAAAPTFPPAQYSEPITGITARIYMVRFSIASALSLHIRTAIPADGTAIPSVTAYETAVRLLPSRQTLRNNDAIITPPQSSEISVHTGASMDDSRRAASRTKRPESAPLPSLPIPSAASRA